MRPSATERGARRYSASITATLAHRGLHQVRFRRHRFPPTGDL
jgi:hypothetical protein